MPTLLWNSVCLILRVVLWWSSTAGDKDHWFQSVCRVGMVSLKRTNVANLGSKSKPLSHKRVTGGGSAWKSFLWGQHVFSLPQPFSDSLLHGLRLWFCCTMRSGHKPGSPRRWHLFSTLWCPHPLPLFPSPRSSFPYCHAPPPLFHPLWQAQRNMGLSCKESDHALQVDIDTDIDTDFNIEALQGYFQGVLEALPLISNWVLALT